MKTAIVLGGTSPHIELIRQVKALGCFVILIDYLSNAPAIPHADEFIQESTLDKEKVLQIARERNASLVISACIDQANSTCCYVAEKLGLPLPYSYETSLDVTDKGRMKAKMVAGGIPTSEFQLFKSIDEVDWSKVVFPAVVKPVDCNSSKGVRRVDDMEDAKMRGEEALLTSRSGRGIIEGFNKGREIQIDCLAGTDGAKVILTREKKHADFTVSAELNSTGSIFPAPCCKGREDELAAIANKIATTFGLRNTPFFYQAVVCDSGIINVLEFAPRVGGGLSYYLIKELAGFDPVKAVIQSFLGERIYAVTKTQVRFSSTNIMYMEEGVFDHVTGLEELKASGLIKEFFVKQEKGAKVSGSIRSGNRVATFIIEADSLEELLDKQRLAYQSVDIIDVNGKSVMRRM